MTIHLTVLNLLSSHRTSKAGIFGLGEIEKSTYSRKSDNNDSDSYVDISETEEVYVEPNEPPYVNARRYSR